MATQIILEIAAHSVLSSVAAFEGGADRIELCQALETGGLTPSYGLIQEVLGRVTIPVHVLIRPRTGDFIYSREEIKVMKRDILFCKETGAQGVVIGALRQNGNVDLNAMKQMTEIAHPLSITFHRAFDWTKSPLEALESLCDLGVDRILTSGQEPSVSIGWPLINRLVKSAAGRIIILAGGGFTPANAEEIIQKSGVSEIHCSAKGVIRSGMTYRQDNLVLGSFAPSGIDHWESDINQIRELRRITGQSLK